MAITRSSRIDLRVTENEKALLEQAAEAQRVSLSNYIMSIVLKQAELDVKANDKIVLDEKDGKIMLDLLLNPPEPPESLVELFKWSQLNQ